MGKFYKGILRKGRLGMKIAIAKSVPKNWHDSCYNAIHELYH